MNHVIELFGNIPLSTVVTFFLAVAAIVGILVKIYKVLVKTHDEFQAKEELINTVSNDLKFLKESQEEMQDSINYLIEEQQNIKNRQEDIESKTKERDKNTLRDRLLQSFRYYTNTEKNPMGAWSEMEKEVFDKLFSDYEALDGNGFMHTVVQPAMEKLDVIGMTDPRLDVLMKSRRG